MIFTNEKAGEEKIACFPIIFRQGRKRDPRQPVAAVCWDNWQKLQQQMQSSSRLSSQEAVGFLRPPHWLLGEGPPDRKGLPQSKAFRHSCLWGSWSLGVSLAASLGKGGGPPPEALLASSRLGGLCQPGQPLSSFLLKQVAHQMAAPHPGKDPQWGGGARKTGGLLLRGGSRAPLSGTDPRRAVRGILARCLQFQGCSWVVRRAQWETESGVPLRSVPPLELLPVTMELKAKCQK